MSSNHLLWLLDFPPNLGSGNRLYLFWTRTHQQPSHLRKAGTADHHSSANTKKDMSYPSWVKSPNCLLNTFSFSVVLDVWITILVRELQVCEVIMLYLWWGHEHFLTIYFVRFWRLAFSETALSRLTSSGSELAWWDHEAVQLCMQKDW